MLLLRHKLHRRPYCLRVLHRLATRLTDADDPMNAEHRVCVVNRLHLHRLHHHEWYRRHPQHNRWTSAAGQPSNVAGVSNSVRNQPIQQRSKHLQRLYHRN